MAALKSVQRKAANLIASDFRETIIIAALLDKQELRTVQHRGKITRPSTLYKLHHDEVVVYIQEYYPSQNTTSIKTGYIIIGSIL